MLGSLLHVRRLTTSLITDQGIFDILREISFHIQPGEIVGLVGESGCGKTMTAYSILRLLRTTARITKGEIEFEGKDLVSLPEKEMRAVRGNRISIIFQDPMSSLNPVMKIGDQISEGLRVHRKMNRKEAHNRSIELLRMVKFPDAERRIHDYPHQLSGGMRQRVMVAMAISLQPALFIADEPTTALDVTTQAGILRLLKSLRDQFGISILFITHSLAVVAQVADRVLVMYAGKIVEQCSVAELFKNPKHPYTAGLIDSIPRTVNEGSNASQWKGIPGNVANLFELPKGCSFYDRCKDRMHRCQDLLPPDFQTGTEHTAACFKYELARS